MCCYSFLNKCRTYESHFLLRNLFDVLVFERCCCVCGSWNWTAWRKFLESGLIPNPTQWLNQTDTKILSYHSSFSCFFRFNIKSNNCSQPKISWLQNLFSANSNKKIKLDRNKKTTKNNSSMWTKEFKLHTSGGRSKIIIREKIA